MWVKICGNTRIEDVRLAAALGADAVGFIFATSKRQVTAEQVETITSALESPVERVGVFDSHDAHLIISTALQAGLNTVQLHGGFDSDLLRSVSEKSQGRLKIIQTLHWTLEKTPNSDCLQKLRSELVQIAQMGLADRVLIDSKVNGVGGGTGVAFDWCKARELFADQLARGIRLILAGGLTPENVAAAIRELSPWGVDISSGVEIEPGRKDPERVQRFIANARRVG